MSRHGWTFAFALLLPTTCLLNSSFAESPELLIPPPREVGERGNEPADNTSFDSELQKLKQEMSAAKLLREQAADSTSDDTDDAEQNAEQRRELMQLLTQLATQGISQKKKVERPVTPELTAKPVNAVPVASPTIPEVKQAESPKPPKSHPLITDKIIDPFKLGQNLFKTGDFVGAELAFRRVEVTAENKVMLQYLVATCMRKQSRLDEAARAFRVVAENKDDPSLRDLAKWQLENIRWHQQTDSQLKQLRDLKQRAAPSAPSAKAAAKTDAL